ncbi:hypothetical protein AFV7_gp51 [Betalipothrixvirus pezzuloense]|uniref:Uncharacterized protein n=1 Tax=Betalipothrixvirus pezzuloense TaxID=346883 RepID=A7WKR8_9VIRU|nr:hypothetical protein AFV7_gp51 [Acidianus filamentous virus 7]CAJ31671.1 conserved hypothetical protein [Acidianus filamentous virus 7]
MNGVNQLIIDTIAVTGAIIIASLLILVASTNPSLFNNSSFDNMLNELIIAIASIIAYTLGKNSRGQQ